MRLFICEKPSQGRDIATVLGATKQEEGYLQGSDFQVTWCLGHLLELAPPDEYCENLKPWRMEVLPVLPNEWKMQEKATTKKQLNVIKKLLKKIDHVVIATDADREGDLIGREVLDYFNYKGKVERLWLSALDESSIRKALSDIRPGTSTENLYQAGMGRQRADWLVGMNLTMATSCLFGKKGEGVLSVGRVQTPTLKLVVERDLAFENFKPKDFYELQANFNGSKGTVIAKLKLSEDITDENGQVTNIKIIEEIADKITGAKAEVSSFTTQKKEKTPPLCFSLSALQKAASSKYGFGAKETLDIAQSLYESHKATTYPRTDCGYLPTSQLSEVSEVFQALVKADQKISDLVEKANPNRKSGVWNDKKITAHHGIIPTKNANICLKSMSEKEKKLYILIRSAYLAQFFDNYVYESNNIELICNDYSFYASSNSPINLGWREVMDEEKEDEKDEDDTFNQSLPKYLKGEELVEAFHKCLSKKTKPQPRFNEGTLISAMKSIAKYIDNPSLKSILKETAGIGTEATRANIIETLIGRNYLEKKGKQLISTQRGRDLIVLLPDSITSPETTAVWEQQLEQISTGDEELVDFFNDQVDTLEGMLNQLEAKAKQSGHESVQTSEHPCPECGGSLIRRKGKKGYWWGCSSYPKCKHTCFDSKGSPLIKVNLSA